MKTIRVIKDCTLISGALLITLAISSCNKEDNSPDSEKIIDVDGNIYTSVVIGTQVWMGEDLKVKSYRNGDPIPTTPLNVAKENTPKYQWAYANNQDTVKVYGRLYTWHAANDKRKVCPDGWHVPSEAEWEELKTYLGGERKAGGKLKEAGTKHWQAPNVGATNETKFTALGTGYRNKDGDFVSMKISHYYWSSGSGDSLGMGQRLHYNDSVLLRGGYFKASGVSVRCLKDMPVL